MSALPGGEVSLPPIEGTSEGTVVWERVASISERSRSPSASRSAAVAPWHLDGGVAADRLRDIVAAIRDADNIGEIGIGLNPAAWIADEITEAKKALGTVHIALGDSANEYGGSVECEVHLDGLVMSPTIEFDGRPVVVDGRHVYDDRDRLPGSEGQGDHRPDARRGGRRPADGDRRSARGRPCVGPLVDPDGNSFIDLAGSFAASTIIGHSHPDVVAAVAAQIGVASHVSSAAVSEQRVGFEEDLIAIAPPGLDRVLLGISGADANDTASSSRGR